MLCIIEPLLHKMQQTGNVNATNKHIHTSFFFNKKRIEIKRKTLTRFERRTQKKDSKLREKNERKKINTRSQKLNVKEIT